MSRECWGSATSPEESLDVLMELLMSRRRRYVLDYLIRESGGVADLDAVTEHVRERESSVDGDDHRTVRTTLHHVHLPRLADAGVVTYDPSRRRVRYHGSSLLKDLLDAEIWVHTAR